MSDIDFYRNRLFVLVKKKDSWFSCSCVCPQCVKNTYAKIKFCNWEVIRKGSGTDMHNQTIMLNKLYGKTKQSKNYKQYS